MLRAAMLRPAVLRAVCRAAPTGARRGRRDDGSIAPFVAFLGITMFLLAGLVIDSSRQLTARARAVAIAEEAARAGAEAANPADRDLALDPQLVASRIDAYCAQARASEAHLTDCRLDGIKGADVTVSTRISLPAGPLGMIRSTLNASGTGSAHSEVGTTQDDAQ